MRRYRGSYVRPFMNGLLLAGVPVLGFYGADYLLAPPTSEKSPSSIDSAAIDRAAMDRSARAASNVANSSAQVRDRVMRAIAGVTPAATADSPSREAAGAADGSSAKTGLIASIQQELQRVGCYSGALNGTWSERTRAAMNAFNANVHVNLQTGSPDYIHLTLLQGHSSRACTRSCDGETGSGGACINPLVEARVAPATAPARPTPLAASSQGTWASTVVVAAPGSIPAEALAPVAKAAIAATPADSASSGFAASRSGLESNVNLPGRMAIGALAEPAPDVSAPAAVAPPPRSDARRDAPARVRAASSGGSGRSGSPFAELNRNSP